ncbi:hypothetical protein Vau01_121980 [Virgisporangium aurantiacum]|uniref:Uncharacterized protein n=1 Tax=Virgisporangium aurantiacum TaxID=175570 RepID=A0A8J3ZIE6_9ACTN|nr:hypothetical protein Vau01_121980 [Virgisporangium aurantiacum]
MAGSDAMTRESVMVGARRAFGRTAHVLSVAGRAGAAVRCRRTAGLVCGSRIRCHETRHHHENECGKLRAHRGGPVRRLPGSRYRNAYARITVISAVLPRLSVTEPRNDTCFAPFG